MTKLRNAGRSAVILIMVCLVGHGSVKAQEAAASGAKRGSLYDCFRGITSPPATKKGLENLKRIHGGFSHWGGYSQEMHDAGIFSFPIAISGWSCPPDKIADWGMKKSDGSSYGAYACWNSPFRDYAVTQMENLVRSQPVDGFLLDAVWWGIMGGDQADWCCCEHCQKAYRSKFGAEMPKRIDWNTMAPALMKQCIEWRRDCLEEVYTAIRDRVKAIRPDVAVNIHGGPAWHLDAGNLFSRIRCQRLSDLAYFENYHNEVFYAAFLRGVSQRPTAMHLPYVQDAFHAHDPIAGYSDDNFNAVASSLVAHGCRPVMYLRWEPDGGLTKSYIDLMEPIYREIEEKEPYLKGATPVLYAAIVYSEATKTYYRRNDPNRSSLPHLEGAFETLQKLRVPVEFITDMDMTLETLKKFKVVVLPNTAILSGPEVEAISQYVDGGGSILATYETGLYDELGQMRANFALSNVLGLKYVETRENPWVAESPAGVGAYLAPKGDFLAHLQEILAPRQNTSLHMSGPAIITQPTAGTSRATLALISSSAAGGRIDERAQQTSIPAVHVHQFGKGKAAYISTPLFKLIKIPQITDHDTFPKRSYAQWPFARAEGWVVELTRELLDELAPNPPIRAEGPHHLECTFFEQKEGNRVIVHLLNSTVRVLGKAYPIGPARILIQKDVLTPRKAYTAWPKRNELEIQDKGAYLEVAVPETKIHQIVVLERQ